MPIIEGTADSDDELLRLATAMSLEDSVGKGEAAVDPSQMTEEEQMEYAMKMSQAAVGTDDTVSGSDRVGTAGATAGEETQTPTLAEVQLGRLNRRFQKLERHWWDKSDK